MPEPPAPKPRVGIFGLTGCAGDQLAILNCEDELLELLAAIDLREFLMASSENDAACELDLALVEGAALSRRDEEQLRRIRARSRVLAAAGTCAVWGGVAAMNGAGRAALLTEIYGETGAAYDSTPARALHELVRVDLNIAGCPIEKEQLLAAVANFLNGNAPVYPAYPVCAECRIRENSCLLIDRGAVCCGPLTLAGCHARCPELNVPCAGCRGPVGDANFPAALAMFEEKGIPREAVARKLATFSPAGGKA